MNLIRTLLVVLCAMDLLAGAASALSVDLRATDTGNFLERDGRDHWNDDRLRSYKNDRSNYLISGRIQFDLSTIPDAAHIVSMALTTYGEARYGVPRNDPYIQIHRTNLDDWHRGGSLSDMSLAEALTPLDHGSFPSDESAYTWVLDVSAADWSGDLADDLLTLALRAASPADYAYMYFHGASHELAPMLNVTYEVGGPLSAPEPCALAASGLGLLGLTLFRRRSRQAAR